MILYCSPPGPQDPQKTATAQFRDADGQHGLIEKQADERFTSQSY